MATFPDFPNMWKTFQAYTDHQVLSDNESVSWRNQVVTGSNMRWMIDATTRPLTPAEDRQMQSFITQIRGRGLFDLNVEDSLQLQYPGNLGVAVANELFKPKMDYSVGTSSVELNAPATQAQLPLYSTIRFENHKKLYQVVAKSTNGVTLTLLPTLYKDIESTDKIFIRAKTGQFRLKGGSPTSKQEGIFRTTYEFTFMEELPK